MDIDFLLKKMLLRRLPRAVGSNRSQTLDHFSASRKVQLSEIGEKRMISVKGYLISLLFSTPLFLELKLCVL